MARALLSALALHQQRAAEIGKHCYDNPATVARKGEKNIPPICLTVLGGGRGGSASSWSLASQEGPVRACQGQLLLHFEGMQMYFCPSGLCFAPGSHSCQLAGRRKT